jgi:hypothetical protein
MRKSQAIILFDPAILTVVRCLFTPEGARAIKCVTLLLIVAEKDPPKESSASQIT